MTNKPFYLVSHARGQQKILEFARYLSPTETFSAGLWPELSFGSGKKTYHFPRLGRNIRRSLER
jgi:hypothetical protein